MPVHDFECKLCGNFVPDKYVPKVLGGTKGEFSEDAWMWAIPFHIDLSPAPKPPSDAPPCENSSCSGFEKEPMERVWSTNRMHRTFEAFDFTMDDGKVVRVDNLAALRKIEKDTGDAYARGELKRPFVFRHYTQDPSNKDKNVFEHLRREQVDPKTIRTQAGALMDSGFVSHDYQHKVHHATARALADQPSRNRSRSR